MQLRKIGTALVGAVLTSATLMGGALAADLGNYPAPFATTDDGIQSTIVVGSQGTNAPGLASDIVGAINIGAALAQVGGTVTGGAAAASTVVGAESDDVPLGTDVNDTLNKASYKDNDIAGLLDTKISWNDEDIDVEEEIVLTDNLKVSVSASADEDFGADVVLTMDAKGSIEYHYVIDDADFNYTLVSDAEPLEVTILGKSLKITEVIDATDKIEVSEGVEAAMSMSTTLDIAGQTLEVTAIGDDTVAFKVGVHTEFISDTDGATEVGDSGIKVRVDNILYTDEAETRQVLVTVGTDIISTVSNGDAMELFGEPEDESDAEWVWVIDVTSDESTLTIGAKHNQRHDEPDEAVISVGGSLMLPNDYVMVSLTELTETNMGIYEMSFDQVDYEYDADGITNGGLKDNQDVLVFHSEDSADGFLIGAEESDYVYVSSEGLAYKNDDGDIQQYNATTIFNITFEDSTYEVEVNVTAFGDITITDPLSEVISINATSFDRLGALESDAEANDIKLGSASMAAKEDDVRTAYGTVIVDPENNADADTVVLSIPADRVYATVTISGSGSTVSTVAATEGSYTPAALPATGIAKLDRDAEASKTGNLILVGGPVVNSLVAELAADGKTRTVDEWRTETDGVRVYEDTALIQAVDNAFTTGKTALVVAGYDAADTGNAAYVLQNYAKFAAQLDGKAEVAVTGTTTDAVQ